MPSSDTAMKPTKQVKGSAMAVEDVSGDDPAIFEAESISDNPWNALLVLSCFAVGASSVLFGYDDKIVSPVAAMKAFVRPTDFSPLNAIRDANFNCQGGTFPRNRPVN